MTNTRLKKSFEWSCALIYKNQFFVNHYNLSLTFVTGSDNSSQHNIAYDRVKFFVEEILNDSVLIDANDNNKKKWANLDLRLIECPGDPVDQLLGLLLFSKFNAIMEDRLVITDIEISSTLGENMIYLHSVGEGVYDFGHNSWWNDSKPTWGLVAAHKDRKVVNISERLSDWQSYDLSWEDDDQDSDHSVLFADFNNKDEK